MDNVKKVEAMDFEYFICSHGRLGKKSDVSANLHYREKLRMPSPKPLPPDKHCEQAQASILMDDYKDWEFYAVQRPQNIAGTYRALAKR